MTFINQWLDPARRFEHNYAENLVARFRFLAWPGGARIPETALVPIRGLDAALASSPRVLVTGAAGTGKTAVLAHLAKRHAQAFLSGAASARIPVFISARDLAGTLPAPSDFLEALNLTKALRALYPREWSRNAFASGRMLLLVDDIDALDEDSLKTWLGQYPDTRMVATAKASLPGLSEFRLPAFGDGDILTFARGQDSARADAFVNALKTSRVPRSLTSNPFTLTLLWQIGQSGAPLPAARTALFDAYVDRTLGGSDENAKTFQELGIACLRGEPLSNSFLSKGHGFLRASRNRAVEFTHELWQAYFAARALRQAPGEVPIAGLMQERQGQEVLVFYAGSGDAAELIQESAARRDWAFAGRVVAQARDVRSDLRDSILRELARSAWDGNAEAMDTLADLDDPAGVDELSAHLKDRDAAIRGRAVQMLGSLHSDHALDYLLPQLRDPDADVRCKAIEALGGSLSSRVIEPLLVILRGEGRTGKEDSRARAAAARALGRVGADKAVPALVVEVQRGEPEVRAAAAQALKSIPSSLRIKPLRGLLDSGDDPARKYAADILATC